MSTDRPLLEPLHTPYRLQYLSTDDLNQLQAATLEILERTGVRFPSEKAMQVLADHGALVDPKTQVVKFPPDVVMKAMSTVPRTFTLGAREPSCDLPLGLGCTYFTTDGCGIETVDLPANPGETRQLRPSCKEDVGKMARVSDYLPSIAFIWPMVSAQDHGRTAPLHELEACYNNTVKHVQSETVMGEVPARYAAEIATVIAGSTEDLRKRPPFSLVVCTIAPLVQDKEGIEGAMVLAETGIPVGFLAMPTLGTTAPATLAGALAMGDAEIISATVLMQMVAPGAPVFHSLMQAWADPSSGSYVSYPLDARGRYAPVEMAHHWGMPALGACYGTDSPEAGTWQSAAEPALDPYMIGLTGAEMVTGMGLCNTYTRLYPEQLLMDADLYQRARHYLMTMDIGPETLALEAIHAVGPGGHFLAQKHTRLHMRDAMKRAITHQVGPDGKYLDARQVAIEKTKWILENHQPEPLQENQKKELRRILSLADQALG
jgi:trimethylamine--corrinoid protein Co-methyltransferase